MEKQETDARAAAAVEFVDFAKFCEKKSAYDDARKAYEWTLILRPNDLDLAANLTRLKNRKDLRLASVNGQIDERRTKALAKCTELLSPAGFVYCAGFAAALAPFIFLTRAMKNEDLSSGYPASAASVFAFTYIALPMGMLVQLRQQWAGAFYLLYLLLVVWAGDVFAYFVGKSIGRHLMAPRISPKKTWEGAAASVLASVAVGYLLFHYAQPISSGLLRAGLIQRRDGLFGLEQPGMIPVLLLTIVLNIAAQLGDLVESLIKRGAGVKDSGALLPGHGGMLDRIDALLFAAPVLWYYAAWRVMQ
jgi:phosphatidate cytidylyltransferase